MSLLGILLYNLLHLYEWVIIAAVVISWLGIDLPDVVRQFFTRTVDPVLGWIRQNLPVVYSNVDFSPLVALLGVWFLRVVVVRVLL
jgi:YggT family protein